MRHEDAGLALWLATDPIAGKRQAPCFEPATAAGLARASARQRAGSAVIALGEWLAGETRSRPTRAPRRRPIAGPAA